jgi:hypothetical protein
VGALSNWLQNYQAVMANQLQQQPNQQAVAAAAVAPYIYQPLTTVLPYGF